MSTIIKVMIGIAAVLAAIFLILNLARLWLIKRADRLKGRKLSELYPEAKLKTGFIYFFSPSCAPCRQMTPLLRKMEKSGISARFIDVSVNMAPARALGVIGTPAVVAVEDGIVTDVFFGMQSELMLEEKLGNLTTRRR